MLNSRRCLGRWRGVMYWMYTVIDMVPFNVYDDNTQAGSLESRLGHIVTPGSPVETVALAAADHRGPFGPCNSVL